MTRRALMIAFHFPPFGSSSGKQRTLGFARHLPAHGWAPIILAPRPIAYPVVSAETSDALPDPAVVERSFALDVGRHLSLGGRYLSWMATPDRWNSWLLGGVPAGLRLIRKHQPAVLWSTYPIPTAHLIGYALHRLTGIPWIADFRDPMVYEGWPVTSRQRRVFSWIERQVIKNCHTAVFTTPSTRALHVERYPGVAEERFRVISNGYDETLFESLDAGRCAPLGNQGPHVLVHSGLMEPEDRDPSAFFRALRRLRDAGSVAPERVRIVLRASGQDERYARQLRELGIADVVRLEPPISYRDALDEMRHADGLLLFQGSNCNRQIPAKAYEYLRSGRPVFALADPDGDTAALMREEGIESMAPLDSVDAIERAFPDFLDQLDSGRPFTADPERIRRYSRARLTGELAAMFDSAAG